MSVVAPVAMLEAELVWVISAWDGLSRDTRAAILAIVEAAQGCCLRERDGLPRTFSRPKRQARLQPGSSAAGERR